MTRKFSPDDFPPNSPLQPIRLDLGRLQRHFRRAGDDERRRRERLRVARKFFGLNEISWVAAPGECDTKLFVTLRGYSE